MPAVLVVFEMFKLQSLSLRDQQNLWFVKKIHNVQMREKKQFFPDFIHQTLYSTFLKAIIILFKGALVMISKIIVLLACLIISLNSLTTKQHLQTGGTLQLKQCYLLTRTFGSLGVNGAVSANSWQWAFVGISEYFDKRDLKNYNIYFAIERSKTNETFRVKNSINGIDSYLAVNGFVSAGSYQRAFFGTQSYLKSNPGYTSDFTFNENGQVQCTQSNGVTSYLFSGQLAGMSSTGIASHKWYTTGGWNWAYFGTQAYISGQGQKKANSKWDMRG